MFNVQIAETIIGLITFLIAYCISISITGYLATWVASKVGDDTAEQAGFLTLNPLAHLDPLGTIFLLIFRFGWSRFIPINPFNIIGRYRGLKVLTAFLVEPVAHMVLGILSIICLFGIFGSQVLSDSATLTFAKSSSYIFSIGIILIEFCRVNVILAVVVFLINMLGLGVMLWVEKKPEYSMYANFILLFIPLMLFYVFRTIIFALANQLLHLCVFIAYLLASLLHLF